MPGTQYVLSKRRLCFPSDTRVPDAVPTASLGRFLLRTGTSVPGLEPSGGPTSWAGRTVKEWPVHFVFNAVVLGEMPAFSGGLFALCP